MTASGAGVSEAPPPPARSRGKALRQLAIPLLATAAIAVWIARGIDLASLESAFSRADLHAVILAGSIFCVAFFLLDVVSFGTAYRLYLDPTVPWRDIVCVRGASCFLQVALGPLAPVPPTAYFRLRRGVPILKTLGAEFFVLFCDTYCGVVLLTVGLALTGATGAIGRGWIAFPIVMWALLGVTWLYWLTPARDRFLPRLRNSLFFNAFAASPFRRYLQFLGMRGGMATANVLVFRALLGAFDVHLAPAQIVLLVPVMMLGTFLPTSAGGYGAPQGLAVLLLVHVFGATTQEVALAFSLAWSTVFALGRAIVGAPFLAASWSLLRAPT